MSMKLFLLSFLFIFSLIHTPAFAQNGAPDELNLHSTPDKYFTKQAKKQKSIEDKEIDFSRSLSSCCKVCQKGKACGNSCISRAKACHKPKGCACDGTQSNE